MIPITAEICVMIDKAASSLAVGEDEYTDPADGLVHCRDCGHPCQAVVEAPFLNRVIFPRCACPCEVEKQQRREEARKRQERLEQIKRCKSQELQTRICTITYLQMTVVFLYIQNFLICDSRKNDRK